MPNDSARWERVSAIFAEAVATPAGNRDVYVERACAGDEALRREVEGLLAVNGESKRFFGTLADQAIPLALASLDGSSDEVSHAGRTYGAYRVIEEIGRGGMGVVYRAEDTRLQRSAALKFLPRLMPEDREARTRLIEEARAASMLDHPNICTIFGFEETPEHETFIAMALYGGETLAQRIERAPVPVGEGLAISLGIARGLAAAHARGIRHGDLTPRNVMLPAADAVKILDFGLARGSRHGGSSVLGTPAYMPPEQVRGEPMGCAADVWSLGVTMYELFTGHRPFAGSDAASVLQSVLESPPRPPRQHNAQIPEAIERLILRMLEKDPASRPADAGEVVAALEPILARHRSRRTRVAVSGLVMVLASLVAVAFTTRGAPTPPASVPAARVVFLPFSFDTANGGAEYFAAGMHRVLATELGRIRRLAILTWTTSQPGENTPKARRRLGQALGAVAVLEGQIVGWDSIVLRLHDAKSDRVLWVGGRNFGNNYIEGAGREYARQIATALGVPTTASTPAARRPGTFATDPRTGHVYEAVPVTLDWFDAENAAEARTYEGTRGHLATITSAEENAFISRALPQATQGHYWLGGFREVGWATPKQGWYGVTGEPFEYTAWADGEPNNYLGSEDGITYASGPDSPRWGDGDRTVAIDKFNHGFLVEYDVAKR